MYANVHRAGNRRYRIAKYESLLVNNCESLWQSDSPHFFDTANHFWPIANHFQMDSPKNLFWSTPLFLDKIYPF